jgi:hypothetical protein
VEAAVASCIGQGLLTPDLAPAQNTAASTARVGQGVAAAIG